MINNIPGQITFSDKINLWNTVRDYLAHRRSLDGNHIQTFLPMTFVLDDEREIAAFLRSYKSKMEREEEEEKLFSTETFIRNFLAKSS